MYIEDVLRSAQPCELSCVWFMCVCTRICVYVYECIAVKAFREENKIYESIDWKL
jgi:hypothetical protein